ncbi:coniferyl aldehyde dehydrogenase [Thalassotalea sp. M1531]|uniref:Aldehyde dehydrogenase n=1 Tax=Thalassotalea algicola TaxID=2716224 RepID=A0A7Y0LB78_9GAMM|nr:coniferyl aldehyde dehydrogenase [Thalassotalea algicola]NMP30998.1 coniferyl aldehyde dehydrogenase [Thalassotalea algicola]
MADNKYTLEQDHQLVESLDQLFEQQKSAFRQQPYPSAEQRIQSLKKLKAAMLAYQDELVSALNSDFGCRSADDSKMGDFMPTLMAIDYSIAHIKKWMKPSKRSVGVLFQPAKAYVMYQPLGVIGIITPWNYPLYLSIGPLATALAAGNTAMIKMSEFTPATNEVLAKMLSENFDSSQVAILGGGPKVAAHFSTKAFDHLLFTGSTRVGKLVMAAAAQNLTPVTLELGGKSPTIIDEQIDMKDAVSRFILGKTLNAGQTCVAPDYILCPSNRIDELKSAVAHWFNKMYPSVENNQDYTAIINDAQLSRLKAWLDDATEKGASVTTLGSDSLASCITSGKLPLTLLTDVNMDMTVMQEEIFGPLLPIVSYETVEQAIDYINDRDRPLALYVCSQDSQFQQRILEHTHAGGVCINDAAMHVAQDDLPFGGVGPSGMGHYHGPEGFKTFSKAKPVFAKGKFNSATMAFPPYGKLIHKLIYKFFIK